LLLLHGRDEAQGFIQFCVSKKEQDFRLLKSVLYKSKKSVVDFMRFMQL